ncbi:MAG: tRNA uridine-5-carboxymethylaminomethyl(34) synthesis GTPase MnmE [candidate division KSB1 bacterium]|nr:tRNA uridine-5-carboxymethylaminomethyl(34) synthesis GTPase MnmE [candidate division KSB1 bacterium]MDZ7369281.1 tRNA uridine-5-carboxymethylaminomethyl(34) synthesis GTPase MnmE [candidate division KSB1 bacterium]MDZ7407316.1 tRNA uridine-5-carboxymethylaminomethyl(34) synthesis GTPase MnmE [candidate division KSB1 bacterium]
MAQLFEDDTIVAISSPPGRGAIVCIRVSGKGANMAVAKLLASSKRLEDFPPRTVHLAWLVDKEGRRLDQVTFARYVAPHSYTGEDLIEIFCHGGKWAPAQIVENLCQAGCRLAEPGEFTRRAFFNHKLDLIQAEAIEDVIAAESPVGLQYALQHLEGHFSQRMRLLRQRLVHACALLELGLDFSEEDVEFADRAQLRAELDGLEKEINFLLASFQRGQAIKDGWRVAIIGKPNVGKSSLMNRLLRQDRVIVSSIPGTTRDTVEDGFMLEGQRFRLIDTAGIRTSHDEIESQGIARSRRAAEEAHIILFVSDQSQPADAFDEAIAGECLRFVHDETGTKKIIHLRNKSDLPKSARRFRLPFSVAGEIETSAKTGAGISELERALCAATNDSDRSGEIVLTNLRHKLCLEKARTALLNAKNSLDNNLSAEFVVADLREVIHQIGVLVGEVTTEDILGEIFSHFCIGK